MDLSQEVQTIIEVLTSMGTPENLLGQKRFGIQIEKSFGVSIPNIRFIAKQYNLNHELALLLWESGYREARILAGFIDEPRKVTKEQMDSWVVDFNSWDLCDQVCSSLFDKTEFAFEKAVEYSERKEEYVKRAGFTLMATLAVHRKKWSDEAFLPLFYIMEREAYDDRNFVRKAVNWALRSIGKRSPFLSEEAIKSANRMLLQPYKSSKWIARDAIRELEAKMIN